MPIGPAQKYLARFNGYVLPGYVQKEAFSVNSVIAQHVANYADGSKSEMTGKQNKNINLTLRVWEQDYATCKQEVQKAATIARSKFDDYGQLYVQYSDRYYTAKTTSIKFDKAVPSSRRILDYDLEFECKPWLTSTSTHTLTGTGTIDTDQVSRTSIENGGWTPTIVTVTGTNITISGYTDTAFTGFQSITGTVTNLVIDSENMTATMAGVNQNAIIPSIDYSLFVGPSKTTFVITGASACTIEYNDRWYV